LIIFLILGRFFIDTKDVTLNNKPDFTPSDDQMKYLPAISGNKVNGFGEKNFRNPTIVYWADDPATIPHGNMQLWFYNHNTSDVIQRSRKARDKVSDIEPNPVAPQKQVVPKNEGAGLVKDFVKSLGAADCGIAAFDQAWCYEDKTVGDYPNIIVLALAQEYDVMATAPEDTAGAEVIRVYGEGARMTKILANWIRARGYKAKISSGPMVGDFTMIPAALKAGLGELGKHGSVIHPKLGSNFRLACVLTDMPLAQDVPIKFGADDFCTNCQICIKMCPPNAIFDEKKMVRGAEKYYVNFDKCLPFFNEHAGCSACMIACPWSRPGTGEKMLAKLAGAT
jgi:ferredoxin